SYDTIHVCEAPRLYNHGLCFFPGFRFAVERNPEPESQTSAPFQARLSGEWIKLSDIDLNHYMGKVLIWQENVTYAERNPRAEEP
ncbi:MAG: hypothetical protein KKB12_00585, partial [Candidatus Omnitrophica bacterium]|nr:hypothetical protein [Candidatus Omnitrophota bacterium]